MGSIPSTVTGAAPTGRKAKWGNSGWQKQRMASTSRGLRLSSESCGDPDEVSVTGNGTSVDMLFDPSCIALATNSLTEKQENYAPRTINAVSVEKEAIAMPRPAASTSSWPLTNQNDLRQADFSNYAKSLLISSSVGPEDNVIPDTVRFALTSVVQYLQDHNAELTRAFSLERAGLMEAHQAEKRKWVTEYEKRVAEVQCISEGKVQELNRRLENVFKEHSDALCQLRGVQDWNERVIKQLQGEKATVLVEKLNATENAKVTEKQAQLEVQQLKTKIEEKEKVMEDMNLERSQLMTKCMKLEAQLALIEQKTGTQESLNVGSYADDHAHPSMLQEFACNSVDMATETLAMFLHEISSTNRLPLNSDVLEDFISGISSVIPVEFSSILQVKYTWSHWICFVMFKGFENVVFDVDNGLFSSPLNAKQHALTYLKSFHQNKYKSSSKLYEECHMFRAFCRTKYAHCFPHWLVREGFSEYLPDHIRFDNRGRFSGDGRIFKLFLDVAKGVWLLHHLAFSFDPPAIVLRMAWGEPFDEQFHEPVILSDDSLSSKVVVLMVRPAFRVRNTIIRSRVFLSSMNHKLA